MATCGLLALANCSRGNAPGAAASQLEQLFVEEFNDGGDLSFEPVTPWLLTTSIPRMNSRASAEIFDGRLRLSASQGSIHCAEATATRMLEGTAPRTLAEFAMRIDDVSFSASPFGGGKIEVDFSNVHLDLYLRSSTWLRGSLYFRSDGRTSVLTIGDAPMSLDSFDVSFTADAPVPRISISVGGCGADGHHSASLLADRMEILGR